MHGCEIKDSPKPLKEALASGDESTMLFRDPKEYEQLPEEERARLTLKMRSHWKKVVGDTALDAQLGRTR